MKNKTVVIIGAGISGLKAALELEKHNVEYIVLEARNRIGGRLLTERSSGVPYDLGASWYHDTLNNPLFDKAVEQKHKLYYDDSDELLYDENGLLSNNNKIKQVSDEMAKFIEMYYQDNLDVPDKSLKELVSVYLEQRGHLLNEDQKAKSGQIVRLLELWHGNSWDKLSGKYAILDLQGRNCFNKQGYDTLVENISQKLSEDRIRLNSVVTRIERSLKEIKVVVDDDSTSETYVCDYLIVTVPQSVLSLDGGERGAIEWIPKLPQDIRSALDNMHFGSLGKVIFEFEEKFWPDNDKFVFLGREFEEQIPIQSWDYPIVVLNLFNHFEKPALLILTQSPLTNYIEENPKKAWDLFRPYFAKMNPNLPNPVNQYQTQWSVDPFSRGSYACCEVGDDPIDLIVRLTAGINNIRFAGEHTILEGAGCVHGAHESGKREAQYVLGKLGKIDEIVH